MPTQVDRDSQTVVCDEMLEDLDNIEELRDSLPEHQPRSRWIVLSDSVFLRTRNLFVFNSETKYQVCGLHQQAGQL